MTMKDVKDMLKGHYNGKIVDIEIYFNKYSQLYQATVIVINKNHLVEQYIVDESGFISFCLMSALGDGVVLCNSSK